MALLFFMAKNLESQCLISFASYSIRKEANYYDKKMGNHRLFIASNQYDK